MVLRRNVMTGAAALVGAGAVSRVGAASLPELVTMDGAATQAPLLPSNGRPYNPVVTLNGWSLHWRTNNGVKEFRLESRWPEVTMKFGVGQMRHRVRCDRAGRLAVPLPQVASHHECDGP